MPSNQTDDLGQYLEALQALAGSAAKLNSRRVQSILRRHPRPGGGLFTRDELLRAYHRLCDTGHMEFDPRLARHLRRKPTRTISGVAPVTVLTPPHPCQGDCIYCPTDSNAPKSYLPNEPGVQRAIRFEYDPFAQTAGRIEVFGKLGHATDKVELLILGGTWSDYPPDFQEHFIRRCFDAMNDRPATSLEEAQTLNETAPHRNVGLVIETRPDCINPAEIRHLRRLGVTKVQLGVQSLDDRILALNQRGHTVADTREAVRQLRLAGFKTVLHWMPNLLGATPESDLVDFRRLWDDPALRPDELKIYPCSLLEGTELHKLWQQGEYQPYDEQELVDLLIACKRLIPPYCRLNRLMRDIPAPEIVAGVARSNLRQIIQQQMEDGECRCIRCREIRGASVDPQGLELTSIVYETDATQEHFISGETREGKLVGFLRLSLPRENPELEELKGCAIVRELHVYGPALELGGRKTGRPQHTGLGTQMLTEATRTARAEGYLRLAVIAAIGTRPYYRERGFRLDGTYMIAKTNAD